MNINDNVAVRLTPLAHEILEANYVKEFAGQTRTHDYKAPVADADGWTEFQFWVLMPEFGTHLFNGQVGQLFVDNEIRII